jgi:hypothetical protein
MRLRLEGPLDAEAQLPDNLDETDVGRTWWVGFFWYIWNGAGWQKAVASTKVPDRTAS